MHDNYIFVTPVNSWELASISITNYVPGKHMKLYPELYAMIELEQPVQMQDVGQYVHKILADPSAFAKDNHRGEVEYGHEAYVIPIIEDIQPHESAKEDVRKLMAALDKARANNVQILNMLGRRVSLLEHTLREVDKLFLDLKKSSEILEDYVNEVCNRMEVMDDKVGEEMAKLDARVSQLEDPVVDTNKRQSILDAMSERPDAIIRIRRGQTNGAIGTANKYIASISWAISHDRFSWPQQCRNHAGAVSSSGWQDSPEEALAKLMEVGL